VIVVREGNRREITFLDKGRLHLLLDHIIAHISIFMVFVDNFNVVDL